MPQRITILILVTLFFAQHPVHGLPGAGYQIERIEVRGNERTKSDIILRSLAFQPGERLTATGVDASKDALDETRLFNTVHLASKPGTQEGQAVVVIYVVEKRFGDLGVSGEYTELDGFGVSGDAYHVNLSGEGKIVGAEIGHGERFKQWRFTYADPWLTRSNLLFSVNVSGSSADRDLFRTKDPNARGRYDLERIGGRIAIGRQVSPHHRLLFKAGYEEIQVGEFTRPIVVTDQGEFADEVGLAIGRESLSCIGLDFHTKPSTEPWGSVAGTDFSINVDLSTKILGSSADFVRLDGQLYRHIGLGGRHVLSIGARAGVIFGSEPFYERFFLDGDKQLRGFERREIGPEGGEEFLSAELLYSHTFHKLGRVYGFVEGAAVRRDFVTGDRADQGATVGVGVLLFNRIDISLGLGRTLIVKSHRFGGINVGL